MDRLVILVFALHYLPGSKAGGPIRSISNIIHALSPHFDFRLVTSDRDYKDPSPFADVHINQWNEVGGASVLYADRRYQRAAELGGIIRDVDPDVIYLNTFFHPIFAFGPLLRRRLYGDGANAKWIIAPRGEFSAGAMAFKAWKKWPFLRLARVSGLLDGITWQATSDQERVDIRRETKAHESSIVVARNITETVGALEPLSADSAANGRLKVCFVSRISPKKNLAYAVDVLARTGRPINFNVYGPIEDESLVAACRRIADAAGNRLTIHWHGPVPHEEVRSTFAQHDLFLFPTLGENFGHVIFESLAAGTPVLISDRTPWQDLESHGVGWVRSLDRIQDFVDVIDAFAMMPAEERWAMRYRANDYARTVHRQSPAVEQTRRLLLGVSHS